MTLSSARRVAVRLSSHRFCSRPAIAPCPTQYRSIGTIRNSPKKVLSSQSISTNAHTTSRMVQVEQRAAYATMASAMMAVNGAKIDPFALFSHHDTSKLPPGYEKLDPSSEYAVFLPQIEQSPNDDRAYRIVRLDNGLECLLVSDPKTDKSAAGISVRVGHLSDPENAQGMAHFCEHLLFMGTEKYPAENDYNEYLSENNGLSNAFTGMDETVYFFDVHPPALPGALDRFAQFFIAPLFTASCTEREILAVDSENKKNLQSDMWRLFQLEKSLSSKEHYYWRFGTGNKQTLWDQPLKDGRDVRSELIQWYEKHYSANVMKLVVIGKESLDDLTKLAVDTFSAVNNRSLPPKIFEGSPFTQNELKQSVYAQAVKNIRSLELTFPCPDQAPLFASKPGNFVTHYLGHEGEGSVLSVLKNLGWAEGLAAGAGSGATGFDFFKISIQLTAAGLENHQKVTGIVFAYIDMLQRTEPQEWAFREQSMINEMAFRFVEKGKPMNYVMQLCSQMQKPYPREWLLSAPWLNKEWQPELVRAQLEGLKLENCRLTVASQQPLEGLEWNEKEQWYGTKYRIEPIRSEDPKPVTDPKLVEGLSLPKPNSFIPSNLDILGEQDRKQDPSRRPLCIRETEVSRLWHKKDDRWFVPRAAVTLYIKNPFIDSSAVNAVNTRLYLDLVTDAMNEYSYDADLAGLSYRLDTQADGILMSVDGYNDKLPVLAEVVLKKMSDLVVDPQRFEIIKDQNHRKYANFGLNAPSSLTMYYTSFLTQNKVYTPDEKLAILDSITPETLQAFIPQVLSKMHIEGLVHGNMLKESAAEIIDKAQAIFQPQPLPEAERISPLSLIPPTAVDWILRLPVPNPENINSAIEYYCYIGDDADPALRVRNALLCQLINEPCFDTLRTKEQLGYLVHSSARSSIGSTGFRISIQSERDAAFLESRVDAFLEQFEKYLEELPETKFNQEKTSLVNRMKEDYKNLYQETQTYWAHIHSGYYDFERKTKDAGLIEKLTREDILDFFKRFISPSSSERAKLSVHMQSQHISKQTAAAVSEYLERAGLKLSEDLAAILSAEEAPLLEAVVKQITTDADAQGKPEAARAVQQQLQELHTPSQSGKARIFSDVYEIKKLLQLGPPSKPVPEYVPQLMSRKAV